MSGARPGTGLPHPVSWLVAEARPACAGLCVRPEQAVRDDGRLQGLLRAGKIR